MKNIKSKKGITSRMLVYVTLACLMPSYLWANWSGFFDAQQSVYRAVGGAFCTYDPNPPYGRQVCSDDVYGSIANCGYNYGNMPSSGSYNNAYFVCTNFTASINKYPVVTYIEPGSVIDKSTSCTVTWRFVRTSGFGSPSRVRTAGVVLGMTGSGMDWSRTLSNCRDEILGLGVSWGYHQSQSVLATNLSNAGPGQGRAGSYAKYCLYVDNKLLNPDCPSTNVIAPLPTPDPIVCNVDVDPNIDFGTINVKELNGQTINQPIDLTCSGAGTIYLSLSGGSSVGQGGLLFDFGSGLTGTACLGVANATCSSEDYKQSLTLTAAGTISTNTIVRLKAGTGVVPGSYEHHLVLLVVTP